MLRVFDTRDKMIEAVVPRGGVGCEIGVFAGEFAETLWRTTMPSKLLLIDAWDLAAPVLFSGDVNGNGGAELPATLLHRGVVDRFSGRAGVEILRAWSADGIARIADGSLDWVYIDADHSYEGCLRDLLAIEPKMAPGGLIMGHDYAIDRRKCERDWSFGVGRAVDEFMEKRGWKWVARGEDGCVSYCIVRGDISND